MSSNPELSRSMPTGIPRGFVPIAEAATALGMSVAALQRHCDFTGRVRTVVARGGAVYVHADEAKAVR